MPINRLSVVLISITLYAALMTALQIRPGTLPKFFVTSLLWLAVAVCVINYASSYRMMRARFDPSGWRLMQLVILLNLTIIARGFVSTNANLTTALGNPYNALAFFAPFVVGFAVRSISLYTVNRYLLLSMIVGLLWVGISSILGGLHVPSTKMMSAWILVYPMVFLIGAIGYFGRMSNHAIVAGSMLLVWNIGLVFGSRATVLRVALLYLFRYLKGLPRNVIARFVFPAALVALVAFAFQAISSSVKGTESLFQTGMIYFQKFAVNSVMSIADKADTRTFLYVEVISDLMRTGELWLGRGSSGTYFSPYFLQTGDDSHTRLTVEVGFLSYLLKGGIVAAALNIGTFLFAAYLAIYKSKSEYMRWVGLMLIAHVFILFMENLVALDLYNLCIWLFVGFCLSKDFRALTDSDIKLLFFNKIGRLSFNKNENA